MIIVKDKIGQLANRLWAYSYIISISQTLGQKVYIAGFYRYSSYFPNLRLRKNVKFLFFNLKLIDKLFYKLFEIILALLEYVDDRINLLKLGLDLKGITLLNKDAAKIVFVNSYDLMIGFRELKIDDSILEKNMSVIQDVFSFSVEDEAFVSRELAALKQNSDSILVGVHIRRGDYLNWRNGDYYYSDTDYFCFLGQLSEEFCEKDIVFVVCSDEEVNLDNYAPLNVQRIGNATFVQELCILSNCDYIIGPPSTFSRWASFFGEVPLKLVVKKEEQIFKNDFHYCIMLDKFNNGKLFSL